LRNRQSRRAERLPARLLDGRTVQSSWANAEKAAASCSDPTFSAILAHLTAVAAYLDHSDSEGDSHESDRISNALMDACDEPMKTVFTTQPTTLEGVAALLEHAGRNEFLHESDLDGALHRRDTFLSSYNECCLGESKRFGQDFPLRLAGTVRRLIGGAPSAA
jgi:hypothetical protein